MEPMSVRASDGIELRATVRGGGPRTLLLVHGYPDDSGVWDAVVHELSDRFRVVTYDVRGAGASGVPRHTRGYRIGQLADDVVAVADATSPDQPTHLVGHDWGAIQSFEVACDPSRAPRFESFTCVSGASFDLAGQGLRERLRERDLRSVAGQARRSWYMVFFQLPWLPERLLRGSFGERVKARLEAEELDGGHLAPTFAEDAAHGVNLYRANLRRVRRPRWSRVLLPLRVIYGADDPFVSDALYEGYERYAPGVEITRIPGAGHWLPRTHAPELAALVQGFVDAAR